MLSRKMNSTKPKSPNDQASIKLHLEPTLESTLEEYIQPKSLLFRSHFYTVKAQEL